MRRQPQGDLFSGPEQASKAYQQRRIARDSILAGHERAGAVKLPGANLEPHVGGGVDRRRGTWMRTVECTAGSVLDDEMVDARFLVGDVELNHRLQPVGGFRGERLRQARDEIAHCDQLPTWLQRIGRGGGVRGHRMGIRTPAERQ